MKNIYFFTGHLVSLFTRMTEEYRIFFIFGQIHIKGCYQLLNFVSFMKKMQFSLRNIMTFKYTYLTLEYYYKINLRTNRF